MTVYILHNQTLQDFEDIHLGSVPYTYYCCNYIIRHHQSDV